MDALPRDTDTDVMLRTYRRIKTLQRIGTMTEQDAYELNHVCFELGKLGYTLTPDETDWLPPHAASDH